MTSNARRVIVFEFEDEASQRDNDFGNALRVGEVDSHQELVGFLHGKPMAYIEAKSGMLLTFRDAESFLRGTDAVPIAIERYEDALGFWAESVSTEYKFASHALFIMAAEALVMAMTCIVISHKTAFMARLKGKYGDPTAASLARLALSEELKLARYPLDKEKSERLKALITKVLARE